MRKDKYFKYLNRFNILHKRDYRISRYIINKLPPEPPMPPEPPPIRIVDEGLSNSNIILLVCAFIVLLLYLLILSMITIRIKY